MDSQDATRTTTQVSGALRHNELFSNDIWHCVLDQLDRDATAALSAVSRDLYLLCAPRLYRDFSYWPGSWRKSQARRLKCLIREGSRLSGFLRTVHIYSQGDASEAQEELSRLFRLSPKLEKVSWKGNWSLPQTLLDVLGATHPNAHLEVEIEQWDEDHNDWRMINVRQRGFVSNNLRSITGTLDCPTADGRCLREVFLGCPNLKKMTARSTPEVKLELDFPGDIEFPKLEELVRPQISNRSLFFLRRDGGFDRLRKLAVQGLGDLKLFSGHVPSLEELHIATMIEDVATLKYLDNLGPLQKLHLGGNRENVKKPLIQAIAKFGDTLQELELPFPRRDGDRLEAGLSTIGLKELAKASPLLRRVLISYNITLGVSQMSTLAQEWQHLEEVTLLIHDEDLQRDVLSITKQTAMDWYHAIQASRSSPLHTLTVATDGKSPWLNEHIYLGCERWCATLYRVHDRSGAVQSAEEDREEETRRWNERGWDSNTARRQFIEQYPYCRMPDADFDKLYSYTSHCPLEPKDALRTAKELVNHRNVDTYEGQLCGIPRWFNYLRIRVEDALKEPERFREELDRERDWRRRRVEWYAKYGEYSTLYDVLLDEEEVRRVHDSRSVSMQDGRKKVTKAMHRAAETAAASQ